MYDRKPIPGYPNYEADTEGNIYSVDRVVEYVYGDTGIIVKRPYKGAIMIPRKNRFGYLSLSLCHGGIKKSELVHRLVAYTFLIQLDDKNQINHIDGDKCNNRMDNLEWCNSKENNVHRSSVLKRGCGVAQVHAKLTDDAVRHIRQQAVLGISNKELADAYDMHPKTIWDVVRGATWKHVT